LPTIGNRLKLERERLGLSQTQLAEMCGVVLRSQRNYEKDERAPDATYLQALAAAGVDIGYVITGERLGESQTQTLKDASQHEYGKEHVVGLAEFLAERKKRRKVDYEQILDALGTLPDDYVESVKEFVAKCCESWMYRVTPDRHPKDELPKIVIHRKLLGREARRLG